MKFIHIIIIHHCVARSVAFLSFSAAAAAKSSSSTQKSIPAFCTSFIHPSCCLESVCLKLFLEQISFISLSWKSVHRPPAAFPSPMQAEPLTCHWQGGVTNLIQPCCYIVATLLLLHCCCSIVAATDPTKTHFLRPALPTTPSHLIHSRATLRSVTISTDCVANSLTLCTQWSYTGT